MIKVGSGQQLSGAPVSKGASVWNEDLTNTVWISSRREVQPGYGQRLPPQATVDWTGDQLFACLDTGGIAPVTINVSNDVQNLSNPVGIAEAIAIAGIPSTFLTKIVLSANVVVNSDSGALDVSQYASLLMRVINQANGQKITLTIVWYSDAACTLATGIADNFSFGNHPSALMADAWEIPVRGLGLRILNRSQSQGTASVFLQGTNRLVPSIKQILTTVDPRVLGFSNTNCVAGTPIPLVNLDGLGDYTTLNGNVVAGLAVTGGETGQLVFFYTEYNCTEGGLGVGAVAAATGAQATFNHPNIPIRWQWIPANTIAGVTLSMILMPAGPT